MTNGVPHRSRLAAADAISAPRVDRRGDCIHYVAAITPPNVKATPLLLSLCAVIAATSASAATPADLFATNCASCHGVDGKARTPIGRKLGAKDLSQSTLETPQILAQITNGTKNSRGADRMPAFKDRLAAAEIAALAEYVKTFRK